jgi:hypothetical protein
MEHKTSSAFSNMLSSQGKIGSHITFDDTREKLELHIGEDDYK